MRDYRHTRALSCWTGRLIVGIALLWLAPPTASAQELAGGSRLKLPTIAASAAAAADWASTYHALKHYHVRETNPLLRPFDDSPARVVLIGAAIDAGALVAWNTTVGRKHPRVAAAGLWAMTAFRTFLVVHNMRNMEKAARR